MSTTANLNRPVVGTGAKLLVSVAVAANLLPAALLFYLVHRFGVDVPFWDEWDAFVIPLQRLDRGMLNFSTLLSEHMEHRPLFPRLVSLANAELFHWKRTVEMYVSVVLLILCAWLLFRFVRTYWAHPLTPLLFLPIAWTLFSWRQWENLLMGMGTVFTLMEAGAVLAFLLLHRAHRSHAFVWAAAVAAFVAGFSSGGGLLIWPIGLAQLALQRVFRDSSDKPGPWDFAAWTASGILTWGLFFFGYRAPALPWPTGFSYLIHNPITAGRYIAVMIASPLCWHQSTAQSLGVVVVVLGVWAVFRLCLVHGGLVASAPLLALLAFTALSALASCDHRMGLGVGQALSSRYCSITSLGLVAIYALLVRLAVAERRPADLLMCGAMVGFLISGTMTNFICWRENDYVQERLDSTAMGARALRYIDVVSDEALAKLHPNPDVVRDRTSFLKAHGYSLFHRAVAVGVPATYKGNSAGCSIEAVNGNTGDSVDVRRRNYASGIRVTGWTRELAGAQKPGQLFVSLDGRIDVPAFPSPAGLGDPSGASGFVSYVRTSAVADGEHALELKTMGPDGRSYSTCGSLRIRMAE